MGSLSQAAMATPLVVLAPTSNVVDVPAPQLAPADEPHSVVIGNGPDWQEATGPKGIGGGGGYKGGGYGGGGYDGGKGGYGGKGSYEGKGKGKGGYGGGGGKQSCRQWAAGNCSFGDRCRFSHDP